MPVSYNAVVMFACTLVRSHQIAEDVGVKLEPLSQTVKHWVGHANKMHARKKWPEVGSVHARNEAMKDVFARCHEKTAVQVCTLTIMHYCSVTVNIHAMMHMLLSNIDNLTLPSLCVYRIWP